jgi:hypothetical protein
MSTTDRSSLALAPTIPVPLLDNETDSSATMLTLAHLTGGQRTLVVLTRHADCLFCEGHLSSLLKRRNELGRIVLVTFDDPAYLADLRGHLPFEIVALSDQQRALYNALGMRRARLLYFLRPFVAMLSALRLVRGRRLLRWGVDHHQLGGNVVLDHTGAVVWVHRSRTPDDRPTVDQLVPLMRGHDDLSSAAAAARAA